MADAFDPKHAKRLEDPARLEALPRAAVVSLLRLDGDETVVDYGAGTGIYTIGGGRGGARAGASSPWRRCRPWPSCCARS